MLPNTFAGSGEWNLPGANNLVSIAATASVWVRVHPPRPDQLLEALCHTLMHTTLFLSFPPQFGPRVRLPEGTRVRFWGLLWGLGPRAFLWDPQPQASEAAGLAGCDAVSSRGRWTWLRPEVPGPSLHAQCVRASDGSGQNPVALEVRKNNAETHDLESRETMGKRIFLVN